MLKNLNLNLFFFIKLYVSIKMRLLSSFLCIFRPILDFINHNLASLLNLFYLVCGYGYGLNKIKIFF